MQDILIQRNKILDVFEKARQTAGRELTAMEMQNDESGMYSEKRAPDSPGIEIRSLGKGEDASSFRKAVISSWRISAGRLSAVLL